MNRPFFRLFRRVDRLWDQLLGHDVNPLSKPVRLGITTLEDRVVPSVTNSTADITPIPDTSDTADVTGVVVGDLPTDVDWNSIITIPDAEGDDADIPISTTLPAADIVQFNDTDDFSIADGILIDERSHPETRPVDTNLTFDALTSEWTSTNADDNVDVTDTYLIVADIPAAPIGNDEVPELVKKWRQMVLAAPPPLEPEALEAIRKRLTDLNIPPEGEAALDNHDPRLQVYRAICKQLKEDEYNRNYPYFKLSALPNASIDYLLKNGTAAEKRWASAENLRRQGQVEAAKKLLADWNAQANAGNQGRQELEERQRELAIAPTVLDTLLGTPIETYNGPTATELLDEKIKTTDSVAVRFLLGGLKAGAGTVEGLLELVAEPSKAYEAADKLLNDDAFRAKVADALYAKLTSGKAEDLGEVTVDVVMLTTGAPGVAKAGASTVRITYKVTADTIKGLRNASATEAKTIIREGLQAAAGTPPLPLVGDAARSGTAAGKIKLDLMGGPQSKLGEGWMNYDRLATDGIADDVSNLGKHFKPGQLAEVVANNPRAEFLLHLSPLVEQGGTVIVRGTTSNKFFKQVWEGKAPGMEGFEMVSKTENVPKPDWFRQTGGEKPVVGEINEIVLRKK